MREFFGLICCGDNFRFSACKSHVLDKVFTEDYMKACYE